MGLMGLAKVLPCIVGSRAKHLNQAALPLPYNSKRWCHRRSLVDAIAVNSQGSTKIVFSERQFKK